MFVVDTYAHSCVNVMMCICEIMWCVVYDVLRLYWHMCVLCACVLKLMLLFSDLVYEVTFVYIIVNVCFV